MRRFTHASWCMVVLALLLAVGPLVALAKPGDGPPAGANRAKPDNGDITVQLADEPGGASRAKAGNSKSKMISNPGMLKTADTEARARQSGGSRYIVTLNTKPAKSAATLESLQAIPGVIPTHVYSNVLAGFSAYLTPKAKQALQADGRVKSITPVRRYKPVNGQGVPSGVKRIGTEENTTADIDGTNQGVDADIAILDTGADLQHPDLNIFAIYSCSVPDTDDDYGWDMMGHGTHVAGSAAAIDNGAGVVGVAPGARIWVFQAVSSDGFFYDDDMLDCLDVIQQFATTASFHGEQIDVLNMSIGGEAPLTTCGSDPFHGGVCDVVSAGVTVVVAAGNDDKDASGFSPANFPEVITVSALADQDGKPGGAVGRFNVPCDGRPEMDDHLASFSNFGADVDIAAPGVGIFSTWPRYITSDCANAGYAFLSGTSMASPHVAGAAALVIAEHPEYTPTQVKQALVGAATQTGAIPGDPGSEGILNVDNGGTPPSASAPNNVQVQVAKKAQTGKWLPITASAASAGSGVSRIDLFICPDASNCLMIITDMASPYSYKIQTKKAQTVQIYARAYDAYGNAKNSAKKTVKFEKPKKHKKH